MTRRLLLLAFVFATAPVIVGIGPPAAAQTPAASPVTLTILHTNDQHGHLLPFACREDGRNKEERTSVGGISRCSTLIRRLRASTTNPVIVVDAGDTFTRGPFTLAYRGIADVEAMNAAGYELAAVGNNEFKAFDGADAENAVGAQAALLQVIKRSRFPWVCANAARSNGALLEGVQPYVVREFRGLRVGFLGLTAQRSGTYPQTVGWEIGDPIAAARAWVPEVRKHCDVLVAVTHVGVDADRALAAAVPGIDAIVGGDSHTFLHRPVLVRGPGGAAVPIVQTGEFGVYLGRFDLTFARKGSRWGLSAHKYALLPVGPETPNDPRVDAALRRYVQPFQTPVGSLAAAGSTPADRTRLTTATLVAALKQAAGSDLALNPAGAGMFDVFRSRTVTRYDVYAAMPFRNRVVSVQMTGKEIDGVRAKQPSTVVAGSAARLDPARTYRVGLVDYIATSDYGLDPRRLKDCGADVQQAVIEYLKPSLQAQAGRRPAPNGQAPPRSHPSNRIPHAVAR